MEPVQIPDHLLIHQTTHWTLNHRLDAALPGYLMLGSRASVTALHELPAAALAELGPLLAQAQFGLEHLLKPRRLYMSRYGHMPGYPIHFHIIPICDWVENLFWGDERYRQLQIYAEGPGQTATDGAELTLFVWREFCEKSEHPPVPGPSIATVIASLRAHFQLA